MVEAVSPTIGDVHRVRNAHADRVSVSIHVHGGNISARTGEPKSFVSGYANTVLPNPWRSAG